MLRDPLAVQKILATTFGQKIICKTRKNSSGTTWPVSHCWPVMCVGVFVSVCVCCEGRRCGVVTLKSPRKKHISLYPQIYHSIFKQTLHLNKITPQTDTGASLFWNLGQKHNIYIKYLCLQTKNSPASNPSTNFVCDTFLRTCLSLLSRDSCMLACTLCTSTILCILRIHVYFISSQTLFAQSAIRQCLITPWPNTHSTKYTAESV